MTREEAIKFWKFRYENTKDYTDPHWEAQERREHREYVEALRMAIDALQTEAVQGWIPCSERLPEIACRCLVTLSNNIVAVGTLHSEGEYEDDFGYIVNWGKRWHLEPASMMIAYHEDSVIAWMPLPTPYKGGDS